MTAVSVVITAAVPVAIDYYSFCRYCAAAVSVATAAATAAIMTLRSRSIKKYKNIYISQWSRRESPSLFAFICSCWHQLHSYTTAGLPAGRRD